MCLSMKLQLNNMKNKLTLLLVLLFQLASYSQHRDIKQRDILTYVNPFIGSDNYGTTNPGAIVPRGMASVVPFNVTGKQNKHDKDSDWWSTPYSIKNEYLSGFSHVNLSGVGCPDLGSIILMPTRGELKTEIKDYTSKYKDEKASPGYYSNYLLRHNVKAEMTASERVGISKYNFEKGRANIILNLGLGLTNEQDSYVRIVSDDEVEGFKTNGSFCYNNAEEIYPVYFVVKLSKKSSDYGVWKKSPKYSGVEANWMSYNGKTRILQQYKKPLVGDSIGVYFSYDLKQSEAIEVKVGISYVSIDNARENLQNEAGNASFDELRNSAEQKWRDKLSKIEVEGGSEDDKIKFYTALYHTQIHPNILNDINGDHPKVGSSDIGNTRDKRYTVFSLWDTYRNLHQLLSLVYPQDQADMVKSMLQMYEENQWLPKWELNATETFTMVGDPAAIVIADTYLRGIRDFDSKLALQAMLKSANTIENNPIRPELKHYLKYGYIPVQKEYDGSVSTTLEYCIADFAIAQMAREMGEKKIARKFEKRSRFYKNMYDKESGLMRPRLENGNWYEPFDPLAGANFEAVTGFIEGNSWHYSFMQAFDVKGLIKLNGGNKKFVDKLQSVFDKDLYEADNEPDIGYAFLFNYVKGEEYRSQKEVNKIIKGNYLNSPDGLPGNDDTGTMSAWLTFAMMGIYPDAPARPHYTIVSPQFEKVTIQLDEKYYDSKKIIIEKVNPKGSEIEKIEWNSKKLDSFFIDHKELVKGGELKIYMSE
jgi:predicted alpha-1,2-mannosidase